MSVGQFIISEIRAMCPSGKRVVGGGYTAHGGVGLDVNGPIADGTGWKVLAFNGNVLAAITVQVHAVCVNV